MSLSKRQIWILSIALATVIVISLFAAPGRQQSRSGSTYGRSPDGYGAWYALMASKGVTVHRWQKPLTVLFRHEDRQKTPEIETLNSGEKAWDTISATLPSASPTAFPASPLTASSRPASPITLLQISNGTEPLSILNREWVEAGNILVLLGVSASVTTAPFTSTIASAAGDVHIQTSRRKTASTEPNQPRLRDDFGAIVWQQTLGRGRVVFAVTPNLAANAYQDFAGNFEFLATLVTEPGYPIWVDEYSHGYKDADVIAQETRGNLLGYLAKTPLLLVAIQALVLLLVLVWGQNRRLGPAIALPTLSVDNSEAYIQAMAAVLHKAESSEFVMDTIGKAEQIEVQKALGLGTKPLPLPTLLDAWAQQTGQPTTVLETIFNPANRAHRITESELLRWVNSIQAIRRQLAAKP